MEVLILMRDDDKNINLLKKKSNLIKPLKISDDSALTVEYKSLINSKESPVDYSSLIKPLKISDDSALASLASPLKLLDGTNVTLDYTGLIKPLKISDDSALTVEYKSLINSMEPPVDYSSLIKPLKISDWVLTSPVLKQMNLTNESIDSNHIFKKFSREDYKLKQEYSENCVDYILENKNTHEEIPLKDIAATFAITDVITELTIEDVIEFYNYLIKFPMLGLEHKVGKIIFEQIKYMKLSEFSNVNVFRVRERNPTERQVPFSELEMFEAPYGIASHGRFNVNGQGELYTCESKEVALMEITSNNSEVRYELIEWKLNENVQLLEFTDADSPLIKYCSFQKQTKNNQEYILPNFIAQCAKFHGITGIKYSSVVEPSSNNYVFLNFERTWFEKIKMENDLVFTM